MFDKCNLFKKSQNACQFPTALQNWKEKRENKTHFLLQDFTEIEDLTNCGAIKKKKRRYAKSQYGIHHWRIFILFLNYAELNEGNIETKVFSFLEKLKVSFILMKSGKDMEISKSFKEQ